MKLPKKISPDRLKHALIEVRYISNIPIEVAIGMFYKALDETYFYVNRPQLPFQNSFQGGSVPEVDLSFANQFFFLHDKVKIEFRKNSIIFNCPNGYISWDKYRSEIKKVLQQLQTANVIDSFTRVGMRYISEYPSMKLNDCTNFSFSFGMPDIISEKYSFKSEFNINQYRVILNLVNMMPVLNKANNNKISVSNASTIDIDIIYDNIGIDKADLDLLMKDMENVHDTEKQIFFTLLKNEFLQSLNPEY